jgi:hypothetical protein
MVDLATVGILHRSMHRSASCSIESLGPMYTFHFASVPLNSAVATAFRLLNTDK